MDKLNEYIENELYSIGEEISELLNRIEELSSKRRNLIEVHKAIYEDKCKNDINE